MPVIHRFGGCVIRMYFEDHEPPHVHVAGTDFEAQVAIEDTAILRGSIPPRCRREALDWIVANKELLQRKWIEVH